MAGSVARREDGRWRARYRDAAGKERAKHFRTRSERRGWLERVTGSVRQGTWVDPTERQSLSQSAPRFGFSGKANLAPTTRSRIRSILNGQVLPRWGATADRRDHVDVRAWVAQMSANGAAGWAVRKTSGVLSAVLDSAVKDRSLPSNTAHGVALPSKGMKARKYLTASQVEALADQAGDRGLVVLAFCRLRCGELPALKAGRQPIAAAALNRGYCDRGRRRSDMVHPERSRTAVGLATTVSGGAAFGRAGG